jgi:hypothetical protein
MKKIIERQLEHHELMDWVESASTPEEMQERAEHANAGFPVIVKEEIVDDTAANHEPGQMLPEDQAERAASGSGWQGEEIPDVKKKPATKLQVVRKNAQGQEVQVSQKPVAKKADKQKAKPTPKKAKAVKQPKPKKLLVFRG